MLVSLPGRWRRREGLQVLHEILGLIDARAPYEERQIVLVGAKDRVLKVKSRKARHNGGARRDEPGRPFHFFESLEESKIARIVNHNILPDRDFHGIAL